MGISQNRWHKRRKSGGKRAQPHKKRKHALGRPPSNTKLGEKRIHLVRTRGGNRKYRALRLNHGNYSWGSECCTRKTRIVDVVYNCTSNEMIRTKTLVKNTIVLVDAAPFMFRQWYEAHYLQPLRGKTGKDKKEKHRSRSCQQKFRARQKHAKLEPGIEEQLKQGRVLACITSHPGQCGRADGYILEGKELEFYLKRIKPKKLKNKQKPCI